jgi:hypothetical protein
MDVIVQSPPFFPSACPRCRRVANRALNYLSHLVRCRGCGQVHLAVSRESQSASQDELMTDWSRYVSLLQPDLADLPVTPFPPR